MADNNAKAQVEPTQTLDLTTSLPSYQLHKTSNALLNLWEVAANHLTTEQLHWYSGFAEQAAVLAGDVSKIAENLGCVIADDNDSGFFDDNGNVAQILFNLSAQMDTISGLVEVANNANARLIHPERYKTTGNKKAR